MEIQHHFEVLKQPKTLGKGGVFLKYFNDFQVLNSLLVLKSLKCGVKVFVTYGVLNVFMAVGNLYLGWACTRKRYHSLLYLY